jgi:hypothetical protein
MPDLMVGYPDGYRILQIAGYPVNILNVIIIYYCIFHQNIAINFWQQNCSILMLGKENIHKSNLMKLAAGHILQLFFVLSRISAIRLLGLPDIRPN